MATLCIWQHSIAEPTYTIRGRQPTACERLLLSIRWFRSLNLGQTKPQSVLFSAHPMLNQLHQKILNGDSVTADEQGVLGPEGLHKGCRARVS